MTEILNEIRAPGKTEKGRAAAATAAVFLLGVALGVFSKWLDTLALDGSVWWHRPIGFLGLGVFFSDVAVWLLAALLIAVFSASAARAALNVFLFFAGMCAAYHLCTVLFAGFDPGSYMTIWYAITLLSPLLAVFCWYAKGSGPVALLLDTGILAVFALACFSVGIVYISFRGVLYLLVFLGAAAALYRDPKQILISLVGGSLLAFLLSPLWPFR